MQRKSTAQSELYPYDVNAISYVAHHISQVRFTVQSHRSMQFKHKLTVWGSQVSMIKWGSLTLAQ